VPPTATYRLQLRREFGFRDAAQVVPYLARLGVSHVYCSPVLTAVPGSPHGYDVVDHSRLSPELGDEQGWAELVAACRAHDLGLVVDVVPNHMAVPVPERLNAALWDVLRLGRDSAYCSWFDVDWDAGGGKLLMPVLGRPIDECLRAGEITVDVEAGVVRYYDHEFPIAPGTDKLEAQHYRLAHWRVANEELNYRRFFDVTTLIGVRVELPAVFDATHRRLLRLVGDGEVDGLRIDHPDGLADPGGYLERLRAAIGPGTWLVVEKILEGDEVLPDDWPADGTTGYDAAAAVTQLFVDPAGEEPLTALYTELTGMPADFHTVVEDGKRLAVDRLFGAEVNRLLRELDVIRRDIADGTDLTERGLREALVELIVQFPVYRAYAGDAASQRRIDAAVAQVRTRRPDLSGEVELLRRLLTREVPGEAAAGFAVRFEQTTGPATAKGVEDTAFYRYHRLVALNEVGGDPAVFGWGVARWHEHCARLAERRGAAMTTLSTHDTKRSEDVRARLVVLAEIPDEWQQAVLRWRAAAAPHSPPDANLDYLFWQTLVGAWPIDAERMKAYLEKASREAKQHTSWTDPDEAYDARLRRYVEAVYADDALLADVGAFVDRISPYGDSNALAQKLVALTMPGVPDVYQGQELPDRSLVDPDNRRPVDYAARRAALDALDEDATDVDAKLRVTAAALRHRRENPGAYTGGYAPVPVSGARSQHLVAFGRGDDVVVLATRLPAGLDAAGGWADTRVEVPPGSWRDLLTGRDLDGAGVASILDALPVALLVRPGVRNAP
jgi:(1->4)-alpha-D-glucan 1-alpha-D-glucosylmutase